MPKKSTKENKKSQITDWMNVEQEEVYKKYSSEVQATLDGYKRIVVNSKRLLGNAYPHFNSMLTTAYDEYLSRKDGSTSSQSQIRQKVTVHNGITFNMAVVFKHEILEKFLLVLSFNNEKEKISVLQGLHDEVLKFIEKDSKLDRTSEQIKILGEAQRFGLNCDECIEINYTNQELMTWSDLVREGVEREDQKILKLLKISLPEAEVNARFAKNTLVLLYEIIEHLDCIIKVKEIESNIDILVEREFKTFKKTLSESPIVPAAERKSVNILSLPKISLIEINEMYQEISDTESECSGLDDLNSSSKYEIEPNSNHNNDELGDDKFDYEQMVKKSKNFKENPYQTPNNNLPVEESWFQSLKDNVNETARLTLLPGTEMTLLDKSALKGLIESRDYN